MSHLLDQFKIIFASNGPYGAQVLGKLVEKQFTVDSVLTSADKTAGRGRRSQANPVKKIVLIHHLNIDEFTSQKQFSDLIQKIKPDLVLISDTSLIISLSDLSRPKFGFINVHPSLLPKYRGVSPIQTAVLNGEAQTGVTLIKLDEQIDHGPILVQDQIKINPVDTTESLMTKLAELGADLVIRAIPNYLAGKIKLKEQDHRVATKTKLIKKTDGQIDWTKKAAIIDRQVRALRLWPKVLTKFKDKRLFIHAGEIKDNQFVPTKVQLEGKKIISWPDFLNGQRLTSRQALDIIKGP